MDGSELQLPSHHKLRAIWSIVMAAGLKCVDHFSLWLALRCASLHGRPREMSPVYKYSRAPHRPRSHRASLSIFCTTIRVERFMSILHVVLAVESATSRTRVDHNRRPDSALAISSSRKQYFCPRSARRHGPSDQYNVVVRIDRVFRAQHRGTAWFEAWVPKM